MMSGMRKKVMESKWMGAEKEKIERMREGGKILGKILYDLKEYVKPGMNELEIDAWVKERILGAGAEVSYYEKPDPDFPGAICISVNEELIHGIPEDNILLDGDKVSFDLTIKYRGYYVDSAFTMIVGGEETGALKHLLQCTESAMWAGIETVAPGVSLGDVGYEIEKVLKKGKLGVIRNYVGHGIGEKMHMGPEVPNYGKRGRGYVLQVGDTICIEPMASLGKPDTLVAKDGWTVILKDGSVGAQFEHTILVTENGFEVLTKVG